MDLILLTLLISPALAWELERPADHITIDERTESSYTDGVATVGLGVHTGVYIEDSPTMGCDYVDLKIAATANTRKVIDYGVYEDYYSWHDNLQNQPGGGTLYLGDNDGDWIWMGSVTARFYGGPNSAEYTNVRVSSNGFISFDSDSTDSYYSKNIPDTTEPNTFVAPFWRDLNPNQGGSITYGKVWHWPGSGPYIECFAISWNNIPNKVNGVIQTFQVLIENAPGGSSRHRQSRIWFQYKSVTLDDQTTIGIEDQQGAKGVSYNYQNIGNEMTLKFEQTSNSAFIYLLTIKLIENDAYAEVDIIADIEDPDWVRGYNVILKSEEPDLTGRYAMALAGTATLLMGAISPGGWVAAGAFLLETLLISVEWTNLLAESFSPIKDPEIVDHQNENYMRVRAVDDPNEIFISNAVDASIGIKVLWKFTDENNQDHNLAVTSELTYFEYDAYGTVVNTATISTEVVNLKFTADTNNSFDTARVISSGTYSGVYLGGTDTEDYYTFWVSEGKTVTVWMDPPSNADFDLYLHRPDRTLLDSSEHRGDGVTEIVSGIASTPSLEGYWFIKTKQYSGGGFYTFDLSVYTQYGGDGGGCPYVSTWNGSEYVLDNNLIPAAEHSNGTDVIDYYKLQQPLIHDKGRYSLLISDVDKHSYIDKVQLLAVDHDTAFNIAVTPYGEILTYRNPTSPQTAITKDGTDIANLVEKIDDDLYYEGWPGDYLTVDFEDLDLTRGAKLLVRVDPYPLLCEPVPCKLSIHVQVLKPDGWTDVANFIPRIYWSTDIVDLSAHLPEINGELKVRLYFTGNHRIDYIGLDTTKQEEFETRYANLASATHSAYGDVKETLMNSDNLYAELLPSEQVTLKFTLPQYREDKRDFVIILEGHYFTIN